MWVTAFLGLGSNQASPSHQLLKAVAWLSTHKSIRLKKQSPLYSSPAMVLAGESAEGVSDYLNMVVQIETCLVPEEMLAEIKAQEQCQGRDLGAQRWSSRPIDIDILSYGDQQISTETLTIPHIGIPERDFVLLPWRDIAADTVIPGLGSVADCAASLSGISARVVAARLADSK